MRTAPYLLVDVFTDRPLAGNPLAVFPQPDAVPGPLMQAVAREMNLSETTFVTATSADAYTVRIFSPQRELPFAGHPTLGTAWVLRHLGVLTGAEAVQTSPAGATPLRFTGDLVWLSRSGAAGDPVDSSEVAASLRLAVGRLGFDAAAIGLAPRRLVPAFADAGVRQLMVPVADATTLSELTPPSAPTIGGQGAYVYAPLGPGRVEARFFVPDIGVAEDPATGSAAAGLGIFLAGDGTCELEILQGVAMGRPSTISVLGEKGQVQVGGRVVIAAEATLRVP